MRRFLQLTKSLSLAHSQQLSRLNNPTRQLRSFSTTRVTLAKNQQSPPPSGDGNKRGGWFSNLTGRNKDVNNSNDGSSCLQNKRDEHSNMRSSDRKNLAQDRKTNPTPDQARRSSGASKTSSSDRSRGSHGASTSSSSSSGFSGAMKQRGGDKSDPERKQPQGVSSRKQQPDQHADKYKYYDQKSGPQQQQPHETRSSSKSKQPKDHRSSGAVKHDRQSSRFVLDLGNNQVARIDYKELSKPRGGAKRVIELYHTEVPAELRGRGIGKALARGAFECVSHENDGTKLKLTCSYLVDYLKHHADDKHRRLVVD